MKYVKYVIASISEAIQNEKSGLLRQLCFLAVTVLFCVFASPAHAQDCGTPPTNGLAGHWRFDETSGTTAADSSGNGNTGTMLNGMNGTDDSVNGIIDRAFNFIDADNHGIDVNAAASINDIFDGGGTIALWVKPRVDASSVLAIKTSNVTTVPEGYVFSLDTSTRRPQLKKSFSGGRVEHRTSEGIPKDEWVHVAIVYDSDSVSNDAVFYVNGAVVSSGKGNIGSPVDPSTSDSSRDLIIGGYNAEQHMDDVRFYDRALSEEEIRQVYAAGFSDEGAMIFNQSQAAMEYCNGTDWVMAGTGSYNPNAVEFDGTNDWLQIGPAGVVEGQRGSFSAWFKADDISIDRTIVGMNSGRIKVFYDQSAGQLKVYAENNANAGILNLRTSSLGLSTDQWHHVMASWDLSVPEANLYIDGVSDKVETALVSGSVDYDFGNLYIGDNAGGSEKWDGGLADIWLDFDTYIDLSKAENRRKFISASGMPMYLGADGSIPTGGTPDIFLSGDTENWHTNKGTGGGFTENGEITYSSSRPGNLIIADNPLPYFKNESYVDDVDPSTSYSYNLNFTPTVGNLLVAAMAWDKTISGLSETSGGWTLVAFNTDGGSTSGAMYYKISDGTETSIDLSWTNSEEISIWVGELEGFVASSVLNQSVDTNSGGLSVTSQSTGTTGATTAADAFALALFSIDSGANTDTGRAYTNGFTEKHYVWQVSGPGAAIAYKNLTATGTVETTFSTTDAGDQIAGIMAVFERDPNATFDCYVGSAGKMQYNPDYSVMQYCNGIEWVAMGPLGGQDVTNGLVAQWLLNETSGTTAVDNVGANDGSMDGGLDAATNSVTSPFGPALSFDGVDDKISIGNVAAWNLAGGDSTFSVWFKANPTQFDTYIRFVGRYLGGGPWDGYRLSLDAVGASIEFLYEGTDDAFITSSDTYNDNRWHLVTATVGGGVARLYIDGVLDGQDSYSGLRDHTTGGLFIGGRSSTNSLNGALYDVRIYNRELSATEARQLYEFGLSGGLGDVDNGCISPVATEGEMFYNVDFNVMQYCNGEEWVGIGQ